MVLIIIAIIFVLLFLLLYSEICTEIRSRKVMKFREDILILSLNYNKRRISSGNKGFGDALVWFHGKYSVVNMVYSRKPLTLENWYNKSELEEINK